MTTTMRETRTDDLLAEKTSDAFSFDTYGAKAWKACVRMLLKRHEDFGPREVEAILRSKWTRWAADGAKNPRRPNSADLARFIDKQQDVKAQVAELVRGTF